MSKLTDRKQEMQKKYDDAKVFFDKNYKEKLTAYKSAFDGTVRRDTVAAWRGNYNVPTAFSAVRTELVRTKRGLLNEPTGNFWGMSPREWTEKNAKVAEADGLIFERQSEDGHWSPNLHSVLEDGLKQGAGWALIEWEKRKQDREYYDVDEKGKLTKKPVEDTIMDGNVIKWVNNMKVMPDPNATDYWSCEHIAMNAAFTRDEIENDDFLENLNQAEELAKLNKLMSADKNKDDFNGFYIFGKTFTVLFIEGFMVMDDINGYEHGMIRLVPFLKYPDAGNVIGKGLIEIIYDLCGFQNKVFNLASDNLMLSVLKVFVKEDDDPYNAAALDVYPGKVVNMHPGKKFGAADMGTVPPAYFNMAEMLQGYFSMANGNADVSQQASNTAGAGQNTATGMNIVQQENNMSFADTITYNKKNFIIPILKMLHHNNNQFMTPKEKIDCIAPDKVKALGLKAADLKKVVDMNYLAIGDSSLETKTQKLARTMTIFPLLAQLQQAEQDPNLAQKVNFPALYDFIFSALEVPKELLKHGASDGSQPGGPATGLTPQHLQQIVMAIAKQTGLQPQAIIQQMVAGKGIQQIMQENPNPNATGAPALANGQGTPNAVTQPGAAAVKA